MDIMQAIYTRRSIRRYKDQPVSRQLITKLVEAATLAPSASNTQPWAFVVIQDPQLLKSYSDRAKALYIEMFKDKPDPHNYLTMLSNPNFNIFYNAGTLVAIYCTSQRIQSVGDCCLAAQNLMLAAHSEGLGTCWIGFSLLLLNDSEFKQELGIPQTYTAVAPLIVGYPEIFPANYQRKAPEVLVWK